jgi:hypothetical protein
MKPKIFRELNTPLSVFLMIKSVVWLVLGPFTLPTAYPVHERMQQRTDLRLLPVKISFPGCSCAPVTSGAYGYHFALDCNAHALRQQEFSPNLNWCVLARSVFLITLTNLNADIACLSVHRQWLPVLWTIVQYSTSCDYAWRDGFTGTEPHIVVSGSLPHCS